MLSPPTAIRRSSFFALCLLASLLSCRDVFGQNESRWNAHEEGRRRLDQETAEKHLELALEARLKRLYPQAATELRRCLERAPRPPREALEALASMQGGSEEWWESRPRSKPSAQAVATFAKKAARLREKDRRARLRLALSAARVGLSQTALDEAREVLVEHDEALTLRSGNLRAFGLTLPRDLSTRLLAEAVEIGGRLYLEDEFLEALRPTTALYEARDDTVCVRSQRNIEEAAAFHRLASALIPYLEEELGARPNRRLNLFLCADRGLYERYLETTKLVEFRSMSAFADAQRTTAVIVVDDFIRAEDVQPLVLHELTHLFVQNVAPTPMPSWYTEGLAEIYGAPGTFQWDGEALTVGGRLPRAGIQALIESKYRRGLRGMLADDVLEVWASDRDGVPSFYTEAWALLTFLRESAGTEVARRLLDWEITCRGDGIHGSPEQRRVRSATGSAPRAGSEPAQDLFRELFAEDLKELEAGFSVWLAEYE